MKKTTFINIIMISALSLQLIIHICKENKHSESLNQDCNLYPASMIVTYVNYEEDTVALEDFNGQRWVFYGAEDWIVNDICACIMNDMGTDVVYDDEIVETRYCGWVE